MGAGRSSALLKTSGHDSSFRQKPQRASFIAASELLAKKRQSDGQLTSDEFKPHYNSRASAKMSRAQFQSGQTVDIQRNATSQIKNIMECLEDSQDMTDDEEKDESSKTDSDEESKSSSGSGKNNSSHESNASNKSNKSTKFNKDFESFAK